MSKEKESAGISPNPALLLGVRTAELLGIENTSAISIQNNWFRAGAETYATDFLVDYGTGGTRHLIAKACIKFSPLESMSEWLSRRSRIESTGVKVPELVAVDGATIVEEYVPYEFKALYTSSDEAQQEKLRQLYIDLYGMIIGAGFKPLSLHDLRSHGNDIVVVDFGEDLGSYRVETRDTKLSAHLAEKSFQDFIR
jgi:hypothetical protein